jgi:hypothetical protein
MKVVCIVMANLLGFENECVRGMRLEIRGRFRCKDQRAASGKRRLGRLRKNMLIQIKFNAAVFGGAKNTGPVSIAT